VLLHDTVWQEQAEYLIKLKGIIMEQITIEIPIKKKLMAIAHEKELLLNEYLIILYIE
jgi:hypothetical protein